MPREPPTDCDLLNSAYVVAPSGDKQPQTKRWLEALSAGAIPAVRRWSPDHSSSNSKSRACSSYDSWSVMSAMRGSSELTVWKRSPLLVSVAILYPWWRYSIVSRDVHLILMPPVRGE